MKIIAIIFIIAAITIVAGLFILFIGCLFAEIFHPQTCRCGTKMNVRIANIFTGQIFYRCPHCSKTLEIVVNDDK